MTNQKDNLYFHEEIMLLSLREEDGKLETNAAYIYGSHVASAVMAELIMLGRIEVQKDDNFTVKLLSNEQTENELLNTALNLVNEDKKDRGASHWLSKFAAIKNLRERIAEGLCGRGILKAVEGKAFFFFDKTYYPELNPRPEQDLVARLEKAIFTETREIDERTLVLLSLLRKSELLKIPFEGKALKERRHRMKEITEGNLVSEAAQKAAEAAQTAIMVATMVPIMVTTVIT